MKAWSITEETVFCLLLGLQGAVFVVAAQDYPAQARLFPMVVLVPQVACLAILAVKASRRPAHGAVDGAGAVDDLWSALFWSGTLLALVFASGMVISMALLPIIFMRFYAHEKWGVTLVVAAAISLSLLVFFRTQGIPIYPGVIWEALGRWLSGSA